MPETQTAGYDLVMEWAEDAYQRLLGAGIFDANDFLLGTTSCGLGIPVDLGTPLSRWQSPSTGRPDSRRAPPTSSTSTSSSATPGHPFGSLRIVASVDINTGRNGIRHRPGQLRGQAVADRRSASSVFRCPDAEHVVRPTTLRQTMKSIPLVPFPVNHAEIISNVLMKNADVGIIDDTSPADKDASAFLITFGVRNPRQQKGA